MKKPKTKQPEIKSFAEGLMRMSQKGAFGRVHLNRFRAKALLKALEDVIYYLPDCHCENGDNCHCQDYYFGGIHWIKQNVYRRYPDLSAFENPVPELFKTGKLVKTEASGLHEVFKIADDLYNDNPETDAAINWASNQVHKIYSIFDLCL